MPPMAPIVDEAASLVVVIVIAPVESIVACRLLAASLPFKSLRLLTVPPVPSPKVMLVAVPLPVAPIVSVRPSSGFAAVRAVVPAVEADSDSDVPVPEITRSDVVPVLHLDRAAGRDRGGGSSAGDGVDRGEQGADSKRATCAECRS